MNRIKRALHNLIYGDFLLEKESNRIIAETENAKTMMKYFVKKDHYDSLAFSCKEMGITTALYDGKELVVSLTTHSKRIHSVYSTIESIFQQTWKANRVVLYVSDELFSMEKIPETLKMQMKRGLEIRFVKDVRSYTKLMYALQDFPEANIITVDDDYWYPHDLVERLMKQQQEHRGEICCIECGHMEHSGGKFETLTNFERVSWTQDIEKYEEKFLMLEGFAGVLYPPHVLHADVFKPELFLNLCPSNDDLWFTVMARLQGTHICVVPAYVDNLEYLTLQSEVQDIGLFHNNISGSFDTQLKKVMEHYQLQKFYFE